MQINKTTYIAGGYYVDFDFFGQCRIFGPNNHLYLGFIDIPKHKIRFDHVTTQGDNLKIEGAFVSSNINLYLPTMGDVRTLRLLTGGFTQKTFLQIRESEHTLHGEAQPTRVEFVPAQTLRSRFEVRGSKSGKKANLLEKSSYLENQNFHRLAFWRDYGEFYYGVRFQFPGQKLTHLGRQASWVEIEEIDKPYKGFVLKLKTQNSRPAERGAVKVKTTTQNLKIKSSARATREDGSGKTEIPFTLIAETNDVGAYDQSCVLIESGQIDFAVFGEYAKQVERFWQRTKIEVEHLLCWGKTSGDRFGTVFPRDWMETAALGAGDIPPAGIDYMLSKCLKNVSEKGEGWHEDVVGEYKYKYQAAGYDLFDRKMIDIEPWYFISLCWVSANFWQDQAAVAALERAAGYVIRRARDNEFVTFEPLGKGKKIPEWQGRFGLEQGYYEVGDWRDSVWAYKHIHPVIAPFSVSAVFYPEALNVIKKIKVNKVSEASKLNKVSRRRLEVEIEERELDQLIAKWERAKERYRFQLGESALVGFALALYSPEWKQLRVHHLDEAYLYFLTDAFSRADVVSFAQRLLDADYFYTRSGPLIISHNNELGYTDEEYHGLVIWTKQAAFAVAGLVRALETKKDQLTNQEQQLLKDAAKKTAHNLIRAFCELDGIPELHIDKDGRAALWRGGAGSSVQLWSVVGARRIIREYAKLIKN